jgi:hypothetical protein
MKIQANITALVGRWILDGGRVVVDDTCKQIEALTRTHLIKIDNDRSGWLTLYRDPDDGRFWELDYPQSELHGGGPPRLRVISLEEARQKYPALEGGQ